MQEWECSFQDKQNMKKKKVDNSSIIDANNVEVPKQKERHIVSWSQEEDDILREQIRVHGTGNWTIIASKFKDKTTRQCRRRWFTYLNADFKKGGWSPEEDMLLCEAQKLFGNRWTEIAKVVSGRTDNAVKNRFTTLCKKRAKHEALAKENSATSYVNLNNKRVMFPNGLNANGGSDCFPPLKKRRPCISNTTENCIQQEKFPAGFGPPDHLDRHPFAMLPENAHSCEVNVSTQLPFSHIKATSFDGSVNNSTRGNFLKKDDPKVLALMQQAELLSSLATKVNSERTDQSLDSAWMVFQDFLKQNIESDMTASRISETDFQLEKYNKTVEDFRSSNEGSRSSRREPDTHESSPASSEYSTGSTLPSNLTCDKIEEMQLEDQRFLAEESTDLEKVMLTCDDIIDNTRMVCGYFDSEFSSPLHVTPLFGSLTTAIPSPQFSESEKHFLLKTLGMESTPSSITANPSQPPPCKRSLLHCL